jgi:hypothetical protein
MKYEFFITVSINNTVCLGCSRNLVTFSSIFKVSGGNTLLQNYGKLLSHYITAHPRQQNCSNIKFPIIHLSI